jgi:hypothetical protein
MSIAFALFLLFYLNSTAALLMPGFINMSIILHDQERIKPLHISAPSLLSLNFSRVYPIIPPQSSTIYHYLLLT